VYSVSTVPLMRKVVYLHRDCAAGWVSFCQNWKTKTGTADIIGLSSTTMT